MASDEIYFEAFCDTICWVCAWNAPPSRLSRPLPIGGCFWDFLIGERERLVRSGDTRSGDLLRGIAPFIAVSKTVDLSGERLLGDRRRVASSIAWAMSIADMILWYQTCCRLAQIGGCEGKRVSDAYQKSCDGTCNRRLWMERLECSSPQQYQ
jgi:hypothetical protein